MFSDKMTETSIRVQGRSSFKTLSGGALRITIVCFFGALIPFLVCSITNDEIICLVADFFWMALVFAIILEDILKLNASKTVKYIVVIGFVCRMLVLVWSLIGVGFIAQYISGGDQGRFYSDAIDILNGGQEAPLCNYSYVIAFLFRMFGPFRFIPQFINIAAWYLGLRILYCVSGRCLTYRTAKLLIAFYCILPMQIWITGVLFRESILILTLMLSLLFLYKWQMNGRFRNILLSLLLSLPAVFLHTGTIVVWGLIFFVYVQWNENERKWRKLSIRTYLILLAIILFVPVYSFFSRTFNSYLPTELSFKSITDRYIDVTRATYITENIPASNLYEFAIQTFRRVFYFWASPTPMYWSSPLDIVGVVGNTIPWLAFFILFFRKMMNKRSGRIVLTGFVLLVLFTIVYAWGTTNAGTAIRHRDVLIGPLVMYMFMAVETKDNAGVVE